MKIKNLLFFCLCVSIFSTHGISQSFQKNIYQPGMDMNHYSVELTPGGEYVFAGTIFDAAGRTDMHIFKLDAFGNFMWERTLDKSVDDRALDVVIDEFDDIIVTGYISPSGKGNSQFYVLKLDASGNYLADRRLTGFSASAGTNIIYSSVTGNYIVGGFYSNPLSFPLTNNEAIVATFDNSLNYLSHNQLLSAGRVGTSINDMVEVAGGYFITGSTGPSGPGQAVLAVKLDYGLNLTNNISFESTNSEHCGVSLVYDDILDEIYLLSNNSQIHNPQMTIIRNVASTPIISTEYYIPLDPTFGSGNAAAFQLKPCSWDPTALVAVGYFKTKDDGTGITTNAIPWIIKFDRYTGTLSNGFYWLMPSPNFHSHGGGVFSTYQGEHPYIFTQEILTERADGMGYVFIGPLKFGGDFGIGITTVDYVSHSPCFLQFLYSPSPRTSRLVSVTENYNPVSNSSLGAIIRPHTSSLAAYCEGEGEGDLTPMFNGNTGNNNDQSIASNNERFGGELDIQVSPNPFTNTCFIEVSGQAINGKITVMNTLGQVVYTSPQLTGTYFRDQLNFQSYQSGIYILKFSDGQSEKILKLVKI